jgi:hypothetical protein
MRRSRRIAVAAAKGAATDVRPTATAPHLDPTEDGSCRRSGERPESLRVFGCLPGTGVIRCAEAGVRKASGEETAEGVRRRSS